MPSDKRQPKAGKTQRPAGVVEGTQSLRRAITILRLLAANNESGLSLASAVKASGLNKATAHRLLNALVSEGLAAQDEITRSYFLGFETVALGMAASSRFGIAQLAKPTVVRLAQESGDTAYLSVRSGDDVVCVLREVGSFPIKTLTFPPGARTPLGLGSGPLAILAYLPDDEREVVVRRTVERLQKTAHRVTESELLDAIARARKDGVAQSGARIVSGMAAIAVPVRYGDGSVAGALTIASIEQRLEGKRLQQMTKLLKDEAAALEKKLRGK